MLAFIYNFGSFSAFFAGIQNEHAQNVNLPDDVMDIFENMCRTCGNDCLDAMNIFVDSVVVLEKKLPITELLSACLPASSAPPLPAPSKNDDYPKQICRVCIKKLTMIYEFNNKWVTVNSEFNVALKYEQRRNRSRLSQPPPPSSSVVETVEPDSKRSNADIVFKNEPSDDVPEMEDGLMDDTEINHNLEITKKSSSSLAIAPPTTVKYQCALCEERYQTLAAYQKHHKVTHRNCQFLYYTPGQ